MHPDKMLRYLPLFQSYQSQLSTMKKRIMKYLGHLGGSVNMGLLSNTDKEISEKAIAWDSQQHLKFDVPFEDMKPTIYLGNMGESVQDYS